MHNLAAAESPLIIILVNLIYMLTGELSVATVMRGSNVGLSGSDAVYGYFFFHM